jgi:hypothetical protein
VVDGVPTLSIKIEGSNARVKYTYGFDPSGTEPKSYDVIGDPVAVVPRYQASVMPTADAADTVARRTAVEPPKERPLQ